MSDKSRKIMYAAIIIAIVVIASVGYTLWAYVLNKPTGITLTYWFGDPGLTYSYYELRLIQAFEAAHPDINVELSYFPWGEYRDKLSLLFTVGGEQPDLISEGLNKGWVYQRQGGFSDLTEKINAWGHKDAIPQMVWDTLTYQDKIFGMPHSGHMFALMYNKALVANAGYTLEWNSSQLSYAQLKEMASKIYDPENGISGWMLRDDWLVSGVVNGLFWAQGGRMTADGAAPNSPPNGGREDWDQFTMNTTAGYDTMQFLYDMTQYTVGGPQGAAGQVGASVQTQFAKGLVGFMPEYTLSGPDIIAMNASMKGNIGFTWFPGTVLTGESCTNWIGIPAHAKNPDAAWEFIKFYVSDEWELERAKTTGFLPVRSDVPAPTGGWGTVQILGADHISWFHEYFPKTWIDPYYPEYAQLPMETVYAYEYVLQETKTPTQAVDWLQQRYVDVWLLTHPA